MEPLKNNRETQNEATNDFVEKISTCTNLFENGLYLMAGTVGSNSKGIEIISRNQMNNYLTLNLP